ncbi:phage protein NinX family protein [Salmonella enterica subsp. enterica serovar Muenchen]
MDYSKLSDFEINSAVHNALMDEPYDIEFLGGDKIRWVRGDTDVTTGKVEYQKNRLKNYCNNPEDAWPIIVENRIRVNPVLYSKWMAEDYLEEISSTHDNPLRAAMIVFLMMQNK